MASNYESFKDLASGIQSLIVSFAVLAGGGWTLYTFRSLASAQKARAELSEIERQQQPALGMAIDAQVSTVTQNGSYELVLNLELRNDGRENISFDVSEPIHIAKLKIEPGKQPVLEGPSWSLESLFISNEELAQQGTRYFRPRLAAFGILHDATRLRQLSDPSRSDLCSIRYFARRICRVKGTTD